MKKYLVKQSAWEAAGFDGEPSPQPVRDVIEVGPQAGCVMLTFPYRWWQPDEVEEAGEEDKPRFQWSATEIVGIGIDNPERVRKTEDGKTVLMPTTYRCPLHQKSGEWPDNPCPVCASNALKLDLAPLELDVEAAARSREKTRALLDTIVTKMEVVHTPPDAPRLESTWTCEIEDSSEVVGLPDNGDE